MNEGGGGEREGGGGINVPLTGKKFTIRVRMISRALSLGFQERTERIERTRRKGGGHDQPQDTVQSLMLAWFDNLLVDVTRFGAHPGGTCLGMFLRVLPERFN